jgi:Pyocin activator protein PrtN
MNSTYFGLLTEFGETNISLSRVAPKYFGLSFSEAKRRAVSDLLPCRVFRLGGQKSPWLVSVGDLAELIDIQRERAERASAVYRPGRGSDSTGRGM